MTGIVFRIARPFLQTYVMKRVAAYVARFLNERRARRLQAELGTEAPDEDKSEAEKCPPVENGYSSNYLVLSGLTGVLIGTALGAGLSYILGEKEVSLKGLLK